MVSKILLPHFYRKAGFILLPVAVVLLIATVGYEYSLPFLDYADKYPKKDPFDLRNYNFSDELAMILTMASLFMIAFSREKQEDEYLQEVRLKALQISVYVNYFVLVAATLFVYGTSYLYVLFGNLYTILIIFIAVYYYRVHFKTRLEG